jgi:CheY-like chemotaxis protein
MNNNGNNTTVLLVEDDEALRSSLGRGLQHAGYHVLAARHGNEALSLYESNKVDIIVTDIFMPEMDGLELIMALRKKGSDTKIIAMTGSLPDHNFLAHAKLFGARHTLEKPFPIEELTQAIELELAG